MRQPYRTLWDMLLIGGLLAVSLLWLFISESRREEGSLAVVRINGAVAVSYPLAADGEFELNGGTNTLVIKEGKAHISHADCPDKLCVGQGEISKKGETITCLPNRVTVTVEGGKGDADIYLP